MNQARPTGGLSLAALALSPDGRWLYAAHAAEVADASRLLGTPGPVVITAWDLVQGGRVGRYVTQPVASPALVALGNTPRVLVLHNEGAFVLEPETGAARTVDHLRREVIWGQPSVDAQGEVAVARRRGGGLVRVTLATGEAQPVAEGEFGPCSVSANGQWIACISYTSGQGGRIRVFHGRDNRLSAESALFPEALSGVDSLLVDDTGTLVVLAGRSGLQSWRPGQDRPTRVSSGMYENPALALGTFGGAQKLRLLSQSPYGHSLRVDVASGREEASESHGYLRAVALSLDGTRGAYGTLEGLEILDFHGISPAPAPVPRHVRTEGGELCAVGFADGPDLLVTASRKGVITTWDRDGKVTGTFPTGAVGIRALKPREDGETLVFLAADGALGTCRPREGSVRRWPTPFVYANELALEPNGDRAFCVHGLVDGMRGKNYGRNLEHAKEDVSTLWSVQRGALLETFERGTQLIQSAAWLNDGSGLMRARRGAYVYLFKFPSWTALQPDSFPFDWSMGCLSPTLVPGGNAIVTVAAGKVVVWDLLSRRTQATLCDVPSAKLLALDPLGVHCVFQTPRDGACVARLSDGAIVKRLGEAAGGEPVTFAAFGASGRTLAFINEGQVAGAVTL